MDVATSQWDRAKLAYWFERYTCDAYGNDVIIWKENKAQRFTVKITYGVAQRLLI